MITTFHPTTEKPIQADASSVPTTSFSDPGKPAEGLLLPDIGEAYFLPEEDEYFSFEI